MGRWSVCCWLTGSPGGCGSDAWRRRFPDRLPKLYNRSMRAACAMVLSAMILPASDFQIDHVTVAGSDIRKLQAGLASIGIPSVYGGAHLNNTTEMALASLPDGAYLELMALRQNADPHLASQHVWARFLKGDAGPCAWALREPDLPAEIRRLKAAGIPVSEPVASGRERPDGVRLDWQTSDEIGRAH